MKNRKGQVAAPAAVVAGLAACLLPVSALAERPEPDRPNIVIIMTDDMGYSNPSIYGGETRTPNLDRLASEGIRFQTFYTMARCSPTRASLLTGYYPTRVGMGELSGLHNDTGLPGYRGILSQEVPTMAEILRDAGYATIMSGKWHLGGEVLDPDSPADQRGWKRLHPDRPLTAEAAAEQFHSLPMQRGFQHFFGIPAGEGRFFATEPHDHPYWRGNAPATLELTRTYTIGHVPFANRPAYNDAGVTTKAWYATDGCTDEALAMLREVRSAGDAPFFLYLPYQAPHHPLEAPLELIEKYHEFYRSGDLAELEALRLERLREQGFFPKNARIRSQLNRPNNGFSDEESLDAYKRRLAATAAMEEVFDQNVGRVLDELEAMGEADDTIVFLLSDNGAAGDLSRLASTPYYGAKALLYEGGVRTHLIVRWPDRIEPGATTKSIGIVTDLLPTVLDAAEIPYPVSHRGKPIPPLTDGRSLLPALQGREQAPPRYLFWELYGQSCVVYEGRWKWLRNGGWYNVNQKNSEDIVELFDLENDPGETHNVAEDHPEIVSMLSAVHHDWAQVSQVQPYDKVLELIPSERIARERRRDR